MLLVSVLVGAMFWAVYELGQLKSNVDEGEERLGITDDSSLEPLPQPSGGDSIHLSATISAEEKRLLIQRYGSVESALEVLLGAD